ncbi:MAG: hypothetical protein HQ543_11960 [Bacteroidetes bacterium]|nr:hypothetical protein [Bacteroidota bacterium]
MLLKTKRLTISTVFFFFIAISIVAQTDGDRSGKGRRFFFGGNFGLQFGSITNIEVSPIAGYRIFPWFSVAAGPKYQLYGENYAGYKFNTHIYGGRTFLRIIVIGDFDEFIPLGFHGGLFAHAEYEALNLERQYFDLTGSEGRFWLNSVLVGGGISQPLSDRASANIMLLWNLNETANSLYNSPIIRFGINF